eukprot:NODE_3025_length_827_cov_85.075835_g2512_i0.p1 GENE.NODE_3025_length_827_cov_85.075835_g2512_i0~~NODE_3025_length_827_cov_85.075835_g2512_i0.p1  ORF type:complete len:230 (-),score=58.94 NODE_3025_length_827_cov_85.075835_g2512_i0:109-798(-)
MGVAIKEHKVPATTDVISSKLSMNEICMLWNLQHENIVKYHGCAAVLSSLVIVMEYVPCGSLGSLLVSFEALEEVTIKSYIRDVLCGLEFLHSNHVVHLDVKPANILLSPDGRCKLADFGTAVALSDLNRSEMGTPAYMSPERTKNVTSPAADLWSVGIATIQLTTGRIPYSDHLEPQTLLVRLRIGAIAPELPSSLSHNAAAFCRACLAWEVEERPDAAQMLKHPFLA